MHSRRCPHSSHGFNIYGTTIYKDSTCVKCILSHYNQRNEISDEKPSLSTNQNFIAVSVDFEEEKPQFESKKYKCPNPLTDTVSHYPSAGGEAEQGVFKPHTPLVNVEDDVRPSEVPSLSDKLRKTSIDNLTEVNNPDKLLQSCFDGDNELEDGQLIAENKRKDITLGKSQKQKKNRENLTRLATQQFYKTSTQRFYEGADWGRVLLKSKRTPVIPLPPTDKHELEGQMRRYHKSKQNFQKMNEFTVWDQAQTRDGFFVKRPISFVSESKRTDQIPDYQGTTSGFGEKDVENEFFTPLTILRSEQPKYSTPGWKPYIPGYTGHVAFNRSKGLFSDEPLPRLESTARAHSRYNTYPQNQSKHRHASMLSNSVTLTNPFNPYNKLSKRATYQLATST